jgi:hypothetical protein
VSTLTLAYRLAPLRRRNGLVEQSKALLMPAGIPVVNPDMTAAEAVAGLWKASRWTYPLLLLGAPVFGLVFAVRVPSSMSIR